MYWKKIDYRYYFVVVLSYALLLILAIGCIFTHADQGYNQLKFYKDSRYQYIYEFSTSIRQNDYLKCSSVDFYANNKPLHGDCLMELRNSNYDSISPVLTSVQLGSREIAISYNLAQKHGLTIGSVLYSKHNIRNQTETYTVAEILPVCYGILKVDFDINYGIIVMGYDADYQENTNYTYVSFFQNDPYQTFQLDQSGLIDIKAKETLMDPMLEKIILWQAVILLGVAGTTVLYIIIHWRYQKNYYRKLVLCGYSLKKLRCDIWLEMVMPGIIGLLTALIVGVILNSLHSAYLTFMTTLISITLGCLILVIASLITAFKGSKM